MKKSKLKVGLTSLVLVCLLGSMVAVGPAGAAMTEEEKFELKREIVAAFYDLAVKYYEKIEGIVTKHEKLTEAEKKDLLEVIDPGIVVFRQQRDDMASAETQEELTALIEKAQENWGEIQTKLKQVEGDILYYRIDKLVAKASIVSGSAKAVSTTFQTLETDTTKLDGLIADFDEQIEIAAREAREGVDIYKTIIRLGDLIKVDDAWEHFGNAWDALELAEKLAIEMNTEMERMVAAQ